MSYKVKLEIFEGPLDLLLHLIKEEELNVFDIPIVRITDQFLEFLNLMEMLDLEISGDFLVMAATLMHIKSRLLLPPDPDTVEIQEDDPRAELVRRLLEYKAFKEASERLRGFEEKRSGLFTRTGVEPDKDEIETPLDEVSLFDLLTAFSRVLKNQPEERQAHEVLKDEFSVADKVHELYHRLARETTIRFSTLFRNARNRYEVITTFLAVLELVRLREILVKQDALFDEIEISRNSKMITPVNREDEANG